MNCAYDIFSANDSDFAVIFPRGKNIEFIEDFYARVGARKAGSDPQAALESAGR